MKRKLLRSFTTSRVSDTLPPTGKGQLVAVLPADQFSLHDDGDRWLIHDLTQAADPDDDPHGIAAAQKHLSEKGTLEGSPHVTDAASYRREEQARLHALNQRHKQFWSPAGQREAASPPSQRTHALHDHEVARGRLVGSIPSERFVVEHGKDTHRIYDFHEEAAPTHDPENVEDALAYLAREGKFEQHGVARDEAILRDARNSPNEMLEAMLRIADANLAQARRARTQGAPAGVTLKSINEAAKKLWAKPGNIGGGSLLKDTKK